MEHSLLLNIVFYLSAALIAVPLFRKLGLGAILGYLAAGAVIGPEGLHLVSDPEHALHFAEFGVVMLLFVIGLELEPEKLWQMRRQIGFLGGGQMLACGTLIGLAVYALPGFSFSIAALIGLTLALSSTAFAVQLMGEHNVMGSPLGRRGLSVLLLQDMAVIPILLLVSFLAPDAEGQNSAPWWLGLTAVAGVLLAGRYAIQPLLRVVAASGVHELLTAAALLIVLGTALLMQASGLTTGMGAFLAGIILANSSFRHQLEADIGPFQGLLLGLFFIAVGMSLDLGLLVEHPLRMMALAVGLVAVKFAAIACLIRLSGHHWKDALMLGLLLSQGGEFAFVVMGKAGDLQLVSETVANQIVLVVGLSMAMTSPLLLLYRKQAIPKDVENAPEYERASAEEPEVVIAGFGRFGQIVGRLLAAHHLKFTALDKDIKHVEFVKRFGNRIFYGDASRLDLLQAAGINHARILVVAVDNVDESMAIVRQTRERYPEVKIIARARNRAHAYQLMQYEVRCIIRETFESSLLAAKRTLMDLGFPESQAIEMVDVFRNHDEQMIQRASGHRDDMQQLIEISAEGRKELETLFQQDYQKHG